jgi:hypothetical protein
MVVCEALSRAFPKVIRGCLVAASGPAAPVFQFTAKVDCVSMVLSFAIGTNVAVNSIAKHFQ